MFKMLYKVFTILLLVQFGLGHSIMGGEPVEHCKRNYGGLKPNPVELNEKHYAGVGEYPWAVGIFKSDALFCAGSLIHQQVVLTAAHCLKGVDISKTPLSIKAGLWSTEKDHADHPSQSKKVKEIIQHPEFELNNDAVKNDISFLILDEPVVLSQAVNIICLPTGETKYEKLCNVTGWGIENGKFATYPENQTLTIIETADCEGKLHKTKLGDKFKVDKSFVCAEAGKDVNACHGEGGAPLTCHVKDDKYVLTGLKSKVYLEKECAADAPEVFTRIESLLPWITDTLQKKGFNGTNL